MAKDPPTTPPKGSPALSQRRLARILGLAEDAPWERVEATLPQLLRPLERRLADRNELESTILRREIDDLATSRAHFAGSRRESQTESEGRHRIRRVAATVAVGLTLSFLIAYAAGYRVVQLGAEDAILPTLPATLILEGRLAGATLRVFDADREELLLKTSAEGAYVELPPGRVALEVSREDCPDDWTRSVYFEEDSTHRFEPRLCAGQGQLTIRSNVSKDRLRIDGRELGSTSPESHPLQVGDHEIRIDKAGYQPYVGTVRIRPNEDLEIHAELVEESGSTSPAGRPMPITKRPPPNQPSSPPGSESFEFAEFSRPVIAKPNLDLSAARLLPLDGPASHTSTDAGSTRWHDRVSADMIVRYDLDASGRIDQLQESEAIECRVWLELERDFDGGGLGLSMARYFGFDGSEWHPNALGFARAHRSVAFEQMKECGLQT